jgi:hypothetical protein
MIRLFWIDHTEKWLKALAWSCGLLIAFSAALLKFDPETFTWPIVQDILTANRWVAWWLIPVLTLLGSLAGLSKQHVGHKSTWSGVNTLLEEFRNSVFKGREGFNNRANHHERVTLYKFRKFRIAFCLWPFTGWMVPVARTGHATVSRKIPRFRCPLSRPSAAEGVAGQAFPLKWVLKKKDCTIQSMLGIPIEVKGKPWGSIVIDSQDPQEIRFNTKQIQAEFRILSKLLSKLLED